MSKHPVKIYSNTNYVRNYESYPAESAVKILSYWFPLNLKKNRQIETVKKRTKTPHVKIIVNDGFFVIRRRFLVEWFFKSSTRQIIRFLRPLKHDWPADVRIRTSGQGSITTTRWKGGSEGIVQQPDTNGWPPNDQDKNYYMYAFRLTLIKKDFEGADPY